MKRRRILAATLLVGLSAVVPADAHLRATAAFGGTASTPVETLSTADASGSAAGLAVVGHNAIGGRGYNADVWVHEQHVYVGSWGFSDWNTGGEQRFCPADELNGVSVIDSREPSDPTEVARLRNPSGTSAEDVVAYTAPYGPYEGKDIAVAGIQVCGAPRTDASLFRGLQVWDVTDPASPKELAKLSTGCCTRGLHELEVQHRADLGRTFVYASVPASEYADAGSPSGRRDHAGRGDFRLIDVTDPSKPFEVSDWGVHADLGGPPAEGLGCDPDPEYGHSAEPSADGRRAFVAYWDSGFIELDLSDPRNPVMVKRAAYGPTADGDGHSSNFDDARELLSSADEDFSKSCGSGTEKGFGYLRVWDWAGPPQQIGFYKTPNSSGTQDVNGGDYTIHNPLLVGEEIFASWYTDGIRIIDVADPQKPFETAHFVPPAEHNPVKPSQRGTLTNATQVWGVAHDPVSNLIYASDMNSGLWILRRTD
ncbi:MAG TPA: hypothetical protein VKA57_07250 [Solirubrobacteraceae bacterium]|nr:hypothetical protein [Solirubrobacteraceae bacterium]